MALRDQPYLPLYIQDFLTDEKLIECSASATGVYIRLMCIMHKSDQYGTILLKQKDKQTDKQTLEQTAKQIYFFACKVAKQMPYTFDVVLAGLTELLNEEVLKIDGDFLVQKRMVYDNNISEKRSESGRSGGKKTQKKYNNFAKAKIKANTENEYEIENEYEYETIINKAKKPKFNFKDSLIKFGFDVTLIDEWILIRKNKNLTNTETALNGFIQQVELTKTPKNDILKICVEKSWGGFKAEWFNNLNNNNHVGNKNSRGSDAAVKPLTEKQRF